MRLASFGIFSTHVLLTVTQRDRLGPENRVYVEKRRPTKQGSLNTAAEKKSGQCERVRQRERERKINGMRDGEMGIAMGEVF